MNVVYTARTPAPQLCAGPCDRRVRACCSVHMADCMACGRGCAGLAGACAWREVDVLLGPLVCLAAVAPVVLTGVVSYPGK